MAKSYLVQLRLLDLGKKCNGKLQKTFSEIMSRPMSYPKVLAE